MLKAHSVLVIGDNCFDIAVKGYLNFEEDRNFIPESFRTTPAGTGINFAVAFARLGGAVKYVTPISEDSFGTEIRQFLSKENVSFVDFKTDKRTAIIIAFVSDEGKRTTFALIKDSAYTDIKFETFKKYFSKERDLISGVYVSGGILTEQCVQEEVIKVVEFVKKSNIKVFFDPQVRIGRKIPHFIEVSNEISKMSDVILGNKEELKYIDLPKDALVVEKQGKSGALIMKNGKEIYRVLGVKVNAVDTTGAGDVFNAAFLYAYLKNTTLIKALEFANLTAAFSVTKLGAYFPTVPEIEKFALLNGVSTIF